MSMIWAVAGPATALIRASRVSLPNTDLLLHLGQAVLEIRVRGDSHLVGQNGPYGPELNRLGLGRFSQRGDPLDRLHGTAGHPGKGPIQAAAAVVHDQAADFGLVGPVVGRARGHVGLARPLGDRLALRDRKGKLIVIAQRGFFFGHGTPWGIVNADGNRSAFSGAPVQRRSSARIRRGSRSDIVTTERDAKRAWPA